MSSRSPTHHTLHRKATAVQSPEEPFSTFSHGGSIVEEALSAVGTGDSASEMHGGRLLAGQQQAQVGLLLIFVVLIPSARWNLIEAAEEDDRPSVGRHRYRQRPEAPSRAPWPT